MLPSVVFVLLVAFTGIHANRFRNEFPGPYCAARNDRCCRDRQDGCAQPISTTLCYCDEFCERGEHGDCCPDYEEVCMGITPTPENLLTCVHKKRYLTPYDPPVVDNCNTCKCNNDGSVTCTDNVCLVDDEILTQLHHLERSVGWKATNYSEWWGRTYDEGKVLRLGTFQPMFRVKAMKRLSNKGGALPSYFDASEHWPGLIAEARDQGWCGSSWAFSTATMSSDRFAVMSKGREMAQLAAQQMLACVTRQQACKGGHLDTAWQYLRKVGVVNEECYPYIAAKNACKVHRDDTLVTANCELPQTVNRTQMYKMGPAYSLNNETDIMSEIKERGTVQALMRVYRDFFSYKSGVYRHSAAATPAEERAAFHSVRLIGWGEERIGYDVVKYWIAINSWGPWWGENGRFRILRGSNECDIESYVLASNPYVHEHVQAVRKVGELQELIVGTGYVPHPSQRYPPYGRSG